MLVEVIPKQWVNVQTILDYSKAAHSELNDQLKN